MKRICIQLHDGLDPRGRRGITVRANDAKQIEIVVPDRAGKLVMEVAEVERRVAMMGGLSFHIAVSANEMADREAIIAQLAAHGPGQMRDEDKDYRWVMIDDPARFTQNAAALTELRKDTAVYFAKNNWIGAEYQGDFYLLVWNKPGKMLADTPGQKGWNIASVATVQDENGNLAVRFDFDEAGRKGIRELTGANVRHPLAMVIGGRIYSPPPTIQERLGGTIQMTGGINGYSKAEAEALMLSLTAGRAGVGVSDLPAKIEVKVNEEKEPGQTGQ